VSPKIVLAAVEVVPGSRVPCSATGTPPIYIALVGNFTVLLNTTNIASRKFYQEGNYTCVATNKYGTDVKHFVIKGEKIRYFETDTMHTELRLAIWDTLASHTGRREGVRIPSPEEGRICPHAFFMILIFLICSYENATTCWKFI